MLFLKSKSKLSINKGQAYTMLHVRVSVGVTLSRENSVKVEIWPRELSYVP